MQMLRRTILALGCILSAPAFTMVVTQGTVDEALKGALLIARITVHGVETTGDSDAFALYQATASVDAIEQTQPDGGPLPAVGEKILITVPGGEINEVGVMLSGYTRPRPQVSYRAHLKRWDATRFTIAGFEKGLSPLNSGRAFSRNRTDGSNGDGYGAFLYWDESYFPIPYYISAPTFRNLPAFAEAVDASFRTWRDPANIKIEFLSMGCTSNIRNENDGVNSIILITTSWPFDSNAIAITRNFYVAGTSPKAGLILDSDILLNGVNHQFTTTNEIGKHDVQNIVTHEVGHFLGLGHEVGTPPNTDAVMFAVASPNETKKRNLHANDIEGVKAAYYGVGSKGVFVAGPCVLSSESSGCLAVHGGNAHPFTTWGAIVSLMIFSARGWRWLRKTLL